MGLDVESTIIVGLEFIGDDIENNNRENFIRLHQDLDLELYDESLEDIDNYEVAEILTEELNKELDFEIIYCMVGSSETNNIVLGIAESEHSSSWGCTRVSTILFESYSKYIAQLEIVKSKLRSRGYTWDNEYAGLIHFPYSSW